MRYVTAPKALSIQTSSGEPYRLNDLLAQFVWPLPMWRADAAKRKAFAALSAKLASVETETVALLDEEFEPLARALMEINLQHMPGVAAKLVGMINHVLDAPASMPSDQSSS